jgi:hypothetical protein
MKRSFVSILTIGLFCISVACHGGCGSDTASTDGGGGAGGGGAGGAATSRSDAGCSLSNYWIFGFRITETCAPNIEAACEAVCQTRTGCVLESGNASLHLVACPGDREALNADGGVKD